MSADESNYSEADATHYCLDCEQPLVVEAVLDGFGALLSTGEIACGDCHGTNTTDYNRTTEGER